MKVVAITGGIGSGKSTVAEMFRNLGFPVLDADRVAHGVYKRGTIAYKKIIESFGKKILLGDGIINRKILGDLVFENEELRRLLEEITHPFIVKKMREFIRECREQRASICIIEAALIFEKGKGQLFDCIITVSVDEKTQCTRLIQRDEIPESEVQSKIRSQEPLEVKRQKADRVIDNSGTLDYTKKQVEKIASDLTGMKRDM